MLRGLYVLVEEIVAELVRRLREVFCGPTRTKSPYMVGKRVMLYVPLPEQPESPERVHVPVIVPSPLRVPVSARTFSVPVPNAVETFRVNGPVSKPPERPVAEKVAVCPKGFGKHGASGMKLNPTMVTVEPVPSLRLTVNE